MNEEVKIWQGGVAIDDRGCLSFCNDFNFEGVKRFYMVENFDHNFVRAWHGHKEEGKYVTVVSGAALIALIDLRGIKDWGSIERIRGCIQYSANEAEVKKKWQDFGMYKSEDDPGYTEEDALAVYNVPIQKITCSARKPTVVWIPPGFINGAMNLDDDTRILYFSTKGLGESEGDDYRFEWNTWGADFWDIDYR